MPFGFQVSVQRGSAIAAAMAFFLWLTLASPVVAQGPIISFTPGSAIQTTAGNGAMFFSGDGGPATSAALAKPNAMAMDSAGNLYIADSQNHRVRLVDASGNITTFAGSAVQGFLGDGGPATSACLDTPMSVAVDPSSGNVYIADTRNNVIRVVSGGTISTFAGDSGGKAGYSGDGGPASAALLDYPEGVATDGHENVFIADTNNHVIRMVSSKGIITTVAGNGQQGFFGDQGSATAASLDSPASVYVDSSGNIFIPDTHNHRVREVSGGQIMTVVGNGAIGFLGEGTPALNAALDYPLGVTLDSFGNLFVADANNQRVRRVNSSGTISTVAGTGDQGFFGDAGSPLQSSLDTPSAILSSGGNIVIADRGNQRLRQVTSMAVAFAGQIVGTTSAPQSITVSNAGTGTLTLTSIALSAGPFSITGGSCGTVFPINLTAGANCTLNLVFNPVSVAAASSVIQFADNAPGNPQLISVSGNGIQDGTTTVLATSQGAITYGSSITLTATVAPSTSTTVPPPTGSVTFADGTNVLGMMTLANGSASFPTQTLTSGSHTLAATYSGDTNYQSSSTSLPETVSKAVPTVTLTAKPNPIVSGQSATFTATVTAAFGVPTGAVTFTANSTALGTSSLNSSGVAVLTATLGPGAQAVTAAYNGDANFATASSSALNTQAPAFTLSIAPSSASVVSGQSTSLTVSVAPSGGFNGSVNLSCGNLPVAATCVFSQPSFTVSTSTVSSNLTLETALSAGVTHWEVPRVPPPRLLFLQACLLLAFLAFVLRTRPLRLRNAAFVALFLSVILAAGCASGGGGGGQRPPPGQTTPPGNYSITVNATTNVQGAQSQSITLSVTVTP